MSNGQSPTNYDAVTEDGDDLIHRCSEIFANETGPYQTAKNFSIQNLSETHEQDVDTLVSFRRTLTDVGGFFECLEQSELKQAEAMLDKIENHLKETACNSARVTPEYYLSKIEDDRATLFGLYRVLMLDAPSKRNYRTKMEVIEDRLDRAKKKDVTQWEDQISNFEEANEYARSLYDELPGPRKVRSRLLMIMTSIVSATIAVASFLNVVGLIELPKISF